MAKATDIQAGERTHDTLGHVKECHQPRNERCPHNADSKFDCTCKSNKVVVRKEYRTVEVTDTSIDMHKVSQNIIAEIHPNGLLVLREKGKRTRYSTTLGTVYTRLIWATSMAKAREKKAKRKARKGGRNAR